MCPNCRAVTDLEADVDDPTDGDWEDNNLEEPGPDLATTGVTNGTISEQNERAIDGVEESQAPATARHLPVRDHTYVTTQPVNTSDYTNGSDTTSGLLSRRGARRISPSFTAAQGHPATHAPSSQAPSLRPIASTQPLLGDEGSNEPSIRTPTQTDPFTHDGPMTPTNNAGPFVFDGSAGRVVGGAEVGSMSETDNASLEA